MAKFEAGEIVKLKIGGPEMMVNDVDAKGEGVECVYATEHVLAKEWINVASLEHVNKGIKLPA